jgi:hypothetical protein
MAPQLVLDPINGSIAPGTIFGATARSSRPMSDDHDPEYPKTLSVPEAGRRYFGLSRNAAYDAAQRGDIPTIRVGKLLRVPVRAMEQMLDRAVTPRKSGVEAV